MRDDILLFSANLMLYFVGCNLSLFQSSIFNRLFLFICLFFLFRILFCLFFSFLFLSFPFFLCFCLNIFLFSFYVIPYLFSYFSQFSINFSILELLFFN